MVTVVLKSESVKGSKRIQKGYKVNLLTGCWIHTPIQELNDVGERTQRAILLPKEEASRYLLGFLPGYSQGGNYLYW